MDDTNLVRRKLLDMANKAYNHNIYTYTGFLSLSELSIYNSMKKDLSFIHSDCFGGNQGCERKIICFGSAAELGYECCYPITMLSIEPLIEKYAENLTHRDYLGAILGLGIERSLIGDIIIKEHTAYVYCVDHIAGFISDNLSQVRRTNIKCTICDNFLENELLEPKLKDIEIIAASPRIDAVVASLTKMSRSSVLELFRTGKIFVNGICIENNSLKLKSEDILVIRGFGKYVFDAEQKQTRKGRSYINLKMYV